MKSIHLRTMLIGVVAVSMLLTACGATPTSTAPGSANPDQSASAPAAQTMLTIWHHWGPSDTKGAPLQSVIKDFMAANPDIVIKDEVLPADNTRFTKVETAFTADQEPDLVFENQQGTALEWLDNGLTIPVDEYMAAWGLQDTFYEDARNEWTLPDGRMRAFPVEGFTWPMWYNMRLLKQAGVEQPPTTVDELIVAAEKLRAIGIQPLVVGGKEWPGARLFQLFMASALGTEETTRLFSEGGFAANPQAIAAAETFVRLRDAGVFADSSEGLTASAMSEQFYAGQAAMMHAGSWAYAEVPQELLVDIVLGGVPTANGVAASKPTMWASYNKGIHITRNGQENIAAVERFIKFFYQPALIGRFVTEAGMTPPLTVEVDNSSLNPLFVQSLDLHNTLDLAMFTEQVIPGAVNAQFDVVVGKAYIPGTSARELLEEIDEIYAQNR